MTKFANHFSYQQKIRRVLLGAGLAGISRSKLNQKTRTRVFSAPQLIEIIDGWRAKGWVEVFMVPNQYRDETIYRATTALRDEFSSFSVEGELPTGPSSDSHQDA